MQREQCLCFRLTFGGFAVYLKCCVHVYTVYLYQQDNRINACTNVDVATKVGETPSPVVFATRSPIASPGAGAPNMETPSNSGVMTSSNQIANLAAVLVMIGPLFFNSF